MAYRLRGTNNECPKKAIYSEEKTKSARSAGDFGGEAGSTNNSLPTLRQQDKYTGQR